MKYLQRTFSPHLISTSNLSNIKDDEWEKINKDKQTYMCTDDPTIDDLLYPGFIFSSEDAAEYFDKYMMSWYYEDLRAFTTPRGNLSKTNNIIFIGQRPGHYGAHLSKAESAWLLGPSSKMLIKLCKDANIYPYFTNFYHSHDTEINKDWFAIFTEIVGLSLLYETHYYKEFEFKIVFLGSYDEYDTLVKELNSINIKVPGVTFKIIKIWHPAYLLRSYSEEKYYQWLTNLEKQLK